MKYWNTPTDDLIERLSDSLKSDVDRNYFFRRLKNPNWLESLKKLGFYQNPPKIQQLPDGYVQYPFWPEMQFLKNVAMDIPEKVIDVILEIHAIENPRIYEDVIDIALNVEQDFSTKLKPIIIEYAKSDHTVLSARFDELVDYWASNNSIDPALELTHILVEFHPDPQVGKRIGQGLLNPRPRLGAWQYKELLEKGVGALSAASPYRTASLLIKSTSKMISLLLSDDEMDKNGDEDYSTIWCPRLSESARHSRESEGLLVRALTLACENVYQKAPKSIEQLDQTLRSQRWNIFTRLRQHLYALYPDQRTKPWIREMLLVNSDYDKWEYQFEFQCMIREACERLGLELLTEPERTNIFESILSGPSEPDFREALGAKFTEEAFERRRRYFHRLQLNPFFPVLSGKYATYFQELESDQDKPITDDHYAPFKSEPARVGEERSPKSTDELAKMMDEDILLFLNEWQNAHYDSDEWWVHIGFEGLAQAFQSVFEEQILPDEKRLHFWMENKERLARPIYARAMLSAICARVKHQQFDSIDLWLNFCKWILSHPDRRREPNFRRGEEFTENPDWRHSRRAVADFVGMCLTEEVNVPIEMRQGLASLLNELCTQYDRRLDDDEPVFLNRSDQLTEAINNTRSRSLEYLVNFGYWVRRQMEDQQADTPETFDILEKRFGPHSVYKLTLPEHALLGLQFGRIYSLNRHWAIRHKDDIFPQRELHAWREAFGNFLRYNKPRKWMFDIVRGQSEFAIENLNDLRIGKYTRDTEELADWLGQHLFSYYVWGVYPLTGRDSLLERFYEGTEQDKERWSNLFDYVGRSLKNSGEQLGGALKRKVIDFFDWRQGRKEPAELEMFTSWLGAECLDAKWRLNSYSAVLDLCGSHGMDIYNQVDSLQSMAENHTPLVVECFAKLTGCAVKNKDSIYFQTEWAKHILQAGLKSENRTVREHAEEARENLLHLGLFDVLK